MFPYDLALLAAVQNAPQSISDVVQILENIESICADGDGLKWFNWLYLQVTQAVQARANASDLTNSPSPASFTNPTWVASLDVAFARHYFSAVETSLTASSEEATPGCWQALFAQRNQLSLTRIQFALAGMNAHINHDLPQAILATCQATSIAPQHGTIQYNDYTALDTTLDSLVNAAKVTLRVRLLGNDLPPVSALDNTLAAWSVAAAREAAWNNAELLFHLADAPLLASSFLGTLDGLTALASKTLLVSVP